jgi:hypothetical protein
MDGLSAATFEEEAFGVKRPGKQDSQGKLMSKMSINMCAQLSIL